MNLAMFTSLRAILEHGSFSAAAQAVGCSPSAVSLQVKQLELFLGQPLFDRSTRVVLPTPLARELGGAVGEFLGRVEALRSRPTIAVAGRLKVGAITSMQSEILPRALHRMRERHPLLDLKVAPLNDSDELLAELKSGRIDLALVVRPEAGGSSRLIWRDLHRQPYVMLAPPEALIASPRKMLQTHDWVGYDLGLAGGRVAARYVRGLVPQARCSVELRSMDAIVAMVSLGMGVTVVPQPRRPLVRAYGVREIDLGARGPSRRIAIAWRKTDEGSRNITAAVECFAAAFDAGQGEPVDG